MPQSSVHSRSPRFGRYLKPDFMYLIPGTHGPGATRRPNLIARTKIVEHTVRVRTAANAIKRFDFEALFLILSYSLHSQSRSLSRRRAASVDRTVAVETVAVVSGSCRVRHENVYLATGPLGTEGKREAPAPELPPACARGGGGAVVGTKRGPSASMSAGLHSRGMTGAFLKDCCSWLAS